MERPKLLNEISGIASTLKDSIEQRGGRNKIVFDKYATDFLISKLNSQQFVEWSQDLEVSDKELNEILNYMTSSSFISAWYHVSGNKTKRDKAAQSCSTLISGLGKDPEQVMLKYLEFERFWRKKMKEEGITPINFRFWGLLMLVIVFIISFMLFY